MNKQCIIAFLFCIIPFVVPAQVVTGFWKGTLEMNRGCFPVNNIEIQITIKGDSIFGNSYHYLDVDNYIKKKFSGTYNAALKKVILQEGEVTTLNIPARCRVCVKRYELTYSRDAKQEFLTGDWTGVLMGTVIDCEAGPISLSRIKESAFREIPEIPVDTGVIRLDFYDNGQIDDDSISVRINKVTVLSQQKLSAKPITVFVKVDLSHTFQEVEMIAENLGSIPPNTALLIVTAASLRYELYLTSTDKKSARVRFVYDKGKPL